MNYSKQLEMMNRVGDPKFIYDPFYEQYDTYLGIGIFIIAVLLCFMLSSVFAQEYSSKMYMIIASSAKGKRTLMWSKMLACKVIAVAAVLMLNLFLAVIFLGFGGSYGSGDNLNSLTVLYAYSPYSISIAQYFCIRILFQLLSVTALVSILGFLSLRLRSGLITTLIGLFLVFGGIGFRYLTGGVNTVLSYFSVTYGLDTYQVFNRYVSFNFFGTPVLYPTVMPVFLAAVTLIFTVLTYSYYIKGKCNIVK